MPHWNTMFKKNMGKINKINISRNSHVQDIQNSVRSSNLPTMYRNLHKYPNASNSQGIHSYRTTKHLKKCSYSFATTIFKLSA